MSYLAFTSREREVHVRGWERHRLPGICQDMAWGLFGVTPASPAADRVRELMSPRYLEMDCFKDRELGWGVRFTDAYRLFLTHGADPFGDGPLIQWKGHGIEPTPLLLNTVLALGSGPMKLAARFAGQAYSHAWIPGANREWAADLITDGLLTDVFRMEIQSEGERYKTGWTDVVQLLRETDAGSVTLSVSTGDDFPDAHILGIPGQDFRDIQSSTDGNDQIWDLAEIWLRNRHRGHMISPNHWDTYRFDHRLTVFDLTASDYAERLDRALEEKRI